MDFQRNDVVRCVNKRANPESRLVIGRLYIVDCDDGLFIGIKDISGQQDEDLKGTWSASQFELVDRPYKKAVKQYGIVQFLAEVASRG